MVPKKLVAGVLTVAAAMLGCFHAWRAAQNRVSAADTEKETWGAADPTWSPDGKRLAFSLFGSIWTVAATGGEAQQLTASPGYHAHPAWSPAGDWIAFIRGQAPGGRIPNIAGELVLVNPSTGAERNIKTQDTVAGTLAWSKDGGRIWCALRSPDSGALLSEIDVSSGAVSRIQPPVGQRGLGWVDVAASPSGKEVYFTGSRASVRAPQVWSTSPGGPPFVVQLPLTRYRPEDIVALDRISIVPDGSAIVYSAVVINGKGDYELYRVPRGGGVPAAITNTVRDEFSPAVSPDGKLIAHVSNHMGNIDIFTMPIQGGGKKHVRLTGLKFKNPSGRVRVKLVDEQGAATSVRLYVSASDGKAYCPPGVQIFYFVLAPGSGREGFFVANSDETFPAPAGKLRLTALKGIEYEPAERTVEVAAGETAEVTIQMNRWTNWYQRGWYTGENHYHANYNGSYYQRPVDSLRWLQAEDMNTANMIVANADGAFIHDKEFFRGAVDPLSTPRYVLYWGQEYRNHYPLGHMAFLNIKKQVPPSYTSVIGSDSPYDFPLNTMAALEAKKQGGLVTYVHPMGGRDVFDTGLGAKEAPIGAALDAVNAIDILPFGEASYQLWYRFLNSGFQIAAGAGTDVFTNWRGINQIPGGSRQYVEVGGAMNWDRWIARYREGRNFVTNGPLVSFQVNGEPIGAVIRGAAGRPYQARIEAEITSRTPLRLVELIQNGNVIESWQVEPGVRSHKVKKEVAVSKSCWFAVRVAGHPARGVAAWDSVPRAHTSPIYIHLGGAPVLVKEDVELMVRWVDRLWLLLEDRNNFGPGDNRERARKMFDQALAHYRKKLAAAN